MTSSGNSTPLTVTPLSSAAAHIAATDGGLDMQTELTTLNRQVIDLLAGHSLVAELSPPLLREAVLAYPTRGGKGLRPALLVWACGLFAEPPPGAVKVAAAVELYHTWTLVHDDIIDRDEIRRGAPAAHCLVREGLAATFPGLDLAAGDRYGVNLAMLAGDVQHAWSNLLLTEAGNEGVSPAVAAAILGRLNGEVTPRLVSGEAMDVLFELRAFGDIPAAEVEQMIRLKTGALLRFAAEAGAMIGLDTQRMDHPETTALGEFAEDAGLAFQLCDDLLGMFGDPSRLGKPIGSDLRQGKRASLFAEALARLDGSDQAFLVACLGNAALADADIARAQDLIDGCGARAAVAGRAAELCRSARDRLAQCPANRYRELLAAWLDFLVDRDR